MGTAVPLSGVGDVTISPTPTLQFNANGPVSATTGTLSFAGLQLHISVFPHLPWGRSGFGEDFRFREG